MNIGIDIHIHIIINTNTNADIDIGNNFERKDGIVMSKLRTGKPWDFGCPRMVLGNTQSFLNPYHPDSDLCQTTNEPHRKHIISS